MREGHKRSVFKSDPGLQWDTSFSADGGGTSGVMSPLQGALQTGPNPDPLCFSYQEPPLPPPPPRRPGTKTPHYHHHHAWTATSPDVSVLTPTPTPVSPAQIETSPRQPARDSTTSPSPDSPLPQTPSLNLSQSVMTTSDLQQRPRFVGFSRRRGNLLSGEETEYSAVALKDHSLSFAQRPKTAHVGTTLTNHAGTTLPERSLTKRSSTAHPDRHFMTGASGDRLLVTRGTSANKAREEPGGSRNKYRNLDDGRFRGLDKHVEGHDVTFDLDSRDGESVFSLTDQMALTLDIYDAMSGSDFPPILNGHKITKNKNLQASTEKKTATKLIETPNNGLNVGRRGSSSIPADSNNNNRVPELAGQRSLQKRVLVPGHVSGVAWSRATVTDPVWTGTPIATEVTSPTRLPGTTSFQDQVESTNTIKPTNQTARHRGHVSWNSGQAETSNEKKEASLARLDHRTVNVSYTAMVASNNIKNKKRSHLKVSGNAITQNRVNRNSQVSEWSNNVNGQTVEANLRYDSGLILSSKTSSFGAGSSGRPGTSVAGGNRTGHREQKADSQAEINNNNNLNTGNHHSGNYNGDNQNNSNHNSGIWNGNARMLRSTSEQKLSGTSRGRLSWQRNQKPTKSQPAATRNVSLDRSDIHNRRTRTNDPSSSFQANKTGLRKIHSISNIYNEVFPDVIRESRRRKDDNISEDNFDTHRRLVDWLIDVNSIETYDTDPKDFVTDYSDEPPQTDTAVHVIYTGD